MANKVVLHTPGGNREYFWFNDNVELSMAYRNKEVALHEDVVYRGVICEIIGEFTDEDGILWPTLLAIAPLQMVQEFRMG